MLIDFRKDMAFAGMHNILILLYAAVCPLQVPIGILRGELPAFLVFRTLIHGYQTVILHNDLAQILRHLFCTIGIHVMGIVKIRVEIKAHLAGLGLQIDIGISVFSDDLSDIVSKGHDFFDDIIYQAF